MSSLILGADPGLNGAIGLLDAATGEFIDVLDMPNRFLMPRRVRKGPARRDKSGKAIPLKQDTRRILDAQALHKALSPYADNVVCAAIENVSSRSGQGVKSVFSLGGALWGLQAVLECLGINYAWLPPKTWQSHFGINPALGTDLKIQIAGVCSEIYGKQMLYGPRGGLKDGRSDSLMIARYLFELGPDAKTVGQPPFFDTKKEQAGEAA